MLNFFSLKDKIIFITGGSGNLGTDFTKTLLDAKAKIVVLDINDSEKIKVSENLKYFNLDITKKEEIKEVLEIVKKEWGIPFGLINNAGIDAPPNSNLGSNVSFENYSEEDWNRVMDVNLKGAFFCSQIIGKEMAQNNAGSIVNINSLYGNLSPDQRLYSHFSDSDQSFFKPFVYGASKAGLANLTKYLSTYWASNNVRVNSMTLGGVYNNQDKEFVSKYIDKVPMGRMADVKDFRGALIFLLSDSSSYVTGTDIVIDGGFSAW